MTQSRRVLQGKSINTVAIALRSTSEKRWNGQKAVISLYDLLLTNACFKVIQQKAKMLLWYSTYSKTELLLTFQEELLRINEICRTEKVKIIQECLSYRAAIFFRTDNQESKTFGLKICRNILTNGTGTSMVRKYKRIRNTAQNTH